MKKQPKSSDTSNEPLLRDERLARYPWLLHAFTTRWSGNLSYGVDAGGAGVGRNRSRLLKTLVKPQPAPAGRGRFRLVTLRQRHSDIVRVVDSRLRDVRREPDGALKLVGDALITDQVGLLLAVQVADCLPILLVDPVRRVVANVHAGWRGTLARIVEKTVGQMQLRFGSQPRQLVAAIGPGIHRCCYAVGREVYERYVAQFAEGEALFRCREPSPSEVHWNPKVTGRPLKPTADHRRDAGATSGSSPADATRWFLDLVEANRQQLRAAGLRKSNIAALPFCTACRTDLFFSHRAEARTGRQMALIGIRWRT